MGECDSAASSKEDGGNEDDQTTATRRRDFLTILGRLELCPHDAYGGVMVASDSGGSSDARTARQSCRDERLSFGAHLRAGERSAVRAICMRGFPRWCRCFSGST